MAKFGKILLRRVGGRDPQRQEIFEKLMKELKTPLTGLKPVKNGYNAFTEREEDIDKLLTNEARRILHDIGLEVRIPPKLRALRSVICRKVDAYVGTHSEQEIKEEINRINNNKAIEVTKFNEHTHLFKIEFENADMATNCLLYTSPSPRDKRQSRMPSSA